MLLAFFKISSLFHQRKTVVQLWNNTRAREMPVFTFTILKQYTLVLHYDDILAQQLRIFPELTLQCMSQDIVLE